MRCPRDEVTCVIVTCGATSGCSACDSIGSLPGTAVTVPGASSVADGVEDMLRRRFPKVAIVKSPSEIAATFDECETITTPTLSTCKHW